MTPKDKPLSGQKVSTVLLGKSGGQLPIAPERKEAAKVEITLSSGCVW